MNGLVILLIWVFSRKQNKSGLYLSHLELIYDVTQQLFREFLLHIAYYKNVVFTRINAQNR